jgi:hypothetical protein
MKKNIYEKIAYVICVIFIVWIVASFIDVNAHNDVFAEDYGNYASWNVFELFFDIL